MSSRGRGRGRGYFGRGGGGSAPYRHREEHPAHRGGEEHHGSSHYRGGGGGGGGSHFSPRGGSAGEYSSRHHKEMIAGPPPHHSSREHHSSGRSEERYHHRRGGSSDRSAYDHREHHSSSRRSPPPPPPHHRRPSPPLPPVKRHEHVPLRRHEQILSKLAPDEQYALTKALVATVLQESEGRGGGRGYREDRGMREDRERGYRDESSGRDFRERRPPPFAGPSSRYQSRGGFREDRGRGVYRGRGFRGAPRGGRYESGVQQRLSIPYRGGHDTGYRRKYADYEQSDQPFKRQRLNSEGDAAATGADEHIESRVSREDVDTDDEAAADGGTETKKADADVGTDEEIGEEGTKKPIPQVETAAEGDRAPWREGVGRLFVELQCPHCPAQCSITLKEYKYHLSSGQHLSNMNRLAYKHSQLLMRIRKQQRHQQKQLEDEYLTEHPDQAEVSVSRFCGTCKLNYRCLGGDIKEGLTAHCKSRLHKMQHNYLHPRCLVCRQKGEVATRFKSRMVYEHHVASITHMKSKMEKLEMCPDDPAEDDVGDLDGFMTVDSVGEDEEAGAEEHDEITGDAEAQELAKKAAEAGADEVEDDGPLEDDGSYEPIGLSYVQARKVYFCQLCLLGLKDSGIKRHCSTPSHRSKYFAAKKKAAAAKEAEASSRRKSSDFPRSGGRAEDRDEEEEEDEDDETAVKKENEAVAEKCVQKTVAGNGDKKVDEKDKDDNIGDEDDKDDSEKDYEEYNEKYEYTDPNHKDYEEEAPDEDDLWDEMDREIDDATDEVLKGKPKTNGDSLSSSAPSSKKPSTSDPVDKKVDRENADEKEGEKVEVSKTSPKLKRRLRSAAKKEDTDEEEVADEEGEEMDEQEMAPGEEEEGEEEEEMEEDHRPVADEASEEEEAAATPPDVDTDDE